MRAGGSARWLAGYGALLVVAVTWPFLVPGGAFALRDMMVFDAMALTRASLGWGDLPARNVPQDALLGILPHPVLFLRFAVVGAAACAARAGYLLGRGTFGRAAAMTVAVWNPFVVERLLQGSGPSPSPRGCCRSWRWAGARRRRSRTGSPRSPPPAHSPRRAPLAGGLGSP